MRMLVTVSVYRQLATFARPVTGALHAFVAATSSHASVLPEGVPPGMMGDPVQRQGEADGSPIHASNEEPLYLPAPEAGSRAQLDVRTGNTIKMDSLGPVVGACSHKRHAACLSKRPIGQ
jgi:hypothetical protein